MMSTTVAVVTAPVSILLGVFGGAFWAFVLQRLGADLASPAWDPVVFGLWFAGACAWGALLRHLPLVKRR